MIVLYKKYIMDRFMELTLDEALKKGVEAHEAGQIQEAEGRYNDVLRSQPNHPDANHNMGILTAGVDKMQEALAYFKIALEANPSIGQYWLSYIGALIKLDKLDDAEVVFNQAKDIGVNGEAFDQLEKQLLEKRLQVNEINTMEAESSHSPKPNILDTTKLDKALRLAKRTLKDGQLEQAKSIYEDILQKFPKHKQALIALQSLTGGLIVKPQDPPSGQLQPIINLFTKGHLQQALFHATETLERFPSSVVLYNIAGACNAGLMQFDAAIDSYKQALKINPEFAETYNNMGLALKAMDDNEAAIDSYQKALKIKPNFAEVCCNMGIALRDKASPQAAIESFKQALKINPNYAKAYNNMGSALYDKGDLKTALKSYKKALMIQPDYADAHNNMGVALNDLDHLEAAIDSYEKAISIKPDFTEAHSNMGLALSDRGDQDAAIDSLKQALKLNPCHAEAHCNMGITLKKKGDSDAAIRSYRQALKVKPSYHKVYGNMAIILSEKGDLEEAIDSLKQAIKIKPDCHRFRAHKLHLQSQTCDWPALEQDRGLIATLGISTETVDPFAILPLEDAPERHRVRSENDTKKWLGHRIPIPPVARPPQKPQRLRIGYFSADFCAHPVAYLIAKVLETHDHTRFEVYGYSIGPSKDDNMRQRLKKTFNVFNDVSAMNDKDLALLARRDKIDIAVDLTGHTKNGRLGVFAYRVAPIQVNFLGYPGTIGADFIDYIIADPVLIPSGYEQYYSERILRLPNTYMPSDNARAMATRMMTRSEMGLPEVGFVFCCFNNNYKISPREFDIWMRVLLKVEGSVLWLRNSNVWSEENLRTQAETRGVEPSRLVFAGLAPMDEHLSRQKLADLFLDTFAFNAHTTASEALWAGLPVVTKIGRSFAARVAASLLTAVDLPELITQTEQEYEALIVQLASNPERLAQIRQTLMDNRLSTPLFDTELYTKHLENGYQQAYQRYYDGKPPETICVADLR
jgi:protein O-GlcNAc transferase